MRVLGIDPGTARLGYAVLDFEDKQINLIDCGIIETDKKDSDAKRLTIIRADLQELIDRFKPQVMAVEKIFFFKNPKTIIPVAQARGVVLELGQSKGLEIFEYTPLEMKKIITGNGMADKKIVSKFVHASLDLKQEIKPDDAVDAIGIALSYIRSHAIPMVQN